MREERANVREWRQGAYFYEALCDASALFNPLTKRRLEPYRDAPYDLGDKPKRPAEEKPVPRELAFLEAWAISTNQKFAEAAQEDGGSGPDTRGGVEDGC